jgi:hypothetical protein
MRKAPTTALAVVLLIAGSRAAGAQVIQPPPRSTGGLFGGRQPADPNRTTQQLDFTLDLLGGYDDSISPDGPTSTADPLAPRQSGTTATISGALEYQRGKARSGFEASVRSVVATYQSIDVEPMIGARGHVRGFAQFFERMTVNVYGDADYRPTFMFGTFGTSTSPDAAPPQDPTGGVTELRTVNGGGGADATYDWNVRNHTSGGYLFSRTRSFSPANMDVADRTAHVGHSWNMLRNFLIDASLSFTQQTTEQTTGESQSLDTQTASLGIELRVPISRSRRMTFSVNGGATRVQTLSAVNQAPLEYTTPSGSGSVRMDIGRTWAVSGDVSRTVNMLEGVTPQSFITTAATVWAGGSLGQRAILSLNGTYSDGGSQPGEIGTFDSMGGTAQLEYRVSRCCTVVTSYGYYQHQLQQVANLPDGFPRSIENNSIRLGLTFWLPLYGTFPAEGRR